MIPKKIHYCWFGHAPKPNLVKKCIRSWERHCIGYEIIEWNEDNFDISAAPLYVRQAYQARKWAFVTDYVRLWALVSFGGIYMDTDVEVLKPLDRFLAYEAVSGFENDKLVPTGLIACRKDFPLFKELLQEYDNLLFVREDGSYDFTVNGTRITAACLRHGLILNGELQTIDGFTLFPREYFCPKKYNTGEVTVTKNAYTLHHFAGSWLSSEQHEHYKRLMQQKKRARFRKKLKLFLKMIMGDSLYKKLKHFYSALHFI